jgi:hypothetical protein
MSRIYDLIFSMGGLEPPIQSGLALDGRVKPGHGEEDVHWEAAAPRIDSPRRPA